MTDFIRLADTLTTSLNLLQPPIAISLVDQPAPDVEMWHGASPAGCRFWQEATRRTFATAPRDHDLCAIGIHTHNLEGTPATDAELGQVLKVFADLTYVRSEDVAQIPVMNRRPRFVVYGPLAESPAPPDVVLLFVQASQTLVLSEAAQQIDGGATPALGRPACAIVPQAANTGRAALSLGCCGARAYLDVLTDDVAVFAIPGSKLEEFSARIEALAKANAILTQFHTVRKQQVASGARPTAAETMAAMGA
jgi:uncharacterized protein (DUF169 family)